MNARQQRGLVIAAVCKLRRTNAELWAVPSQTLSTTTYRVNTVTKSCTCPDHTESGNTCKHYYAVEFTAKRELGTDGSVMETRSVTFTEKKTYTQDWEAYNRAQSTEKDRVQILLHDLCQGISEPEHVGRGRKPHSVRDSIFCMAYKVYNMFSSRRSSTDLREAYARGFLTRPVPGLKINQFFENAAFTPILNDLIAKSAAPLSVVETKFAVDSSGFSTSRFYRWFDEKYGVTRQKAIWIKSHIAIGVQTNVVAAVRVMDKYSPDCQQFKPLMETTAESFKVDEVSADKAYSSKENFELVDLLGGTAFVPFKSNATGGKGGLFEKMFHYFQFRQEEFMAHYHLRSNVESTFSAVKRLFGDGVKSRTTAAMTNEVLCKFLCYNLTCLIHEQEKLGIAPLFWQTKAVEEPAILPMVRQDF